MAEIRVTCPTKNLLICAIPVQLVDGEATVGEEVAAQLRPYVKAHGLAFSQAGAQSPAPEEGEQPSEGKPVEESPKAPRKPQGKRQATSPLGN